jgi:hypothetical protein
MGVPTISRFHGITIRMYFRDHTPPHFPAWASGKKASVRIDPVEVLQGSLDRKHFYLVKRWAETHRIELEDHWDDRLAWGSRLGAGHALPPGEDRRVAGGPRRGSGAHSLTKGFRWG